MNRPHARRLSMLVWLGAGILLYWVAAASGMDVAGVASLLKRIDAETAAWLLAVNGFLLITMTGRWWCFLTALGWRGRFRELVLFRMGANAIGYVTPGTQFGGEPFQSWVVHRRHGLPLEGAAASVALERIMEMGINFLVILVGAALLLRTGQLPDGIRAGAFTAIAMLAALAIALFGAWTAGKRPMAALFRNRRFRRRPLRAGIAFLLACETDARRLCRHRRRHVRNAALVSLLNWLLIAAEFWLMYKALGCVLTWEQTVGVLLAARLGLLVPVPGGIGAIEAAQLAAVTALGLPGGTSLAWSVCVMIRLRDVAVVGVGLWVAARWFSGRNPAPGKAVRNVA